jgi:hypothetical protein
VVAVSLTLWPDVKADYKQWAHTNQAYLGAI